MLRLCFNVVIILSLPALFFLGYSHEDKNVFAHKRAISCAYHALITIGPSGRRWHYRPWTPNSLPRIFNVAIMLSLPVLFFLWYNHEGKNFLVSKRAISCADHALITIGPSGRRWHYRPWTPNSLPRIFIAAIFRCGTLITAPAPSPCGPEARQRFQTSDSIHCSCSPSDSVEAILMSQGRQCWANTLHSA
jgi:hypothetical protein